MLDVTALLHSAGFTGDGVDLQVVPARSQLVGTTVHALVSDPGVLTEAVQVYAEAHQEQFGPSAAEHVAALWLLQDAAWIHAVLAVGLIGAHGISVRVAADGLAMELPRGMFFAVQLAEDAVTVSVATNDAERDELYRYGREHMAMALGPLQQPMRSHLRAGARAFWACVTDMATGAICTGATHRADQMASELARFDTGTAPLLTGERLVPSPAGQIRRRHGCCLLYTIDSMGLCFSCPRLPEEP